MTAKKATPAPRGAFSELVSAVFLAGVASLVYEVVWIRQLGLSLGSTAVMATSGSARRTARATRWK